MKVRIDPELCQGHTLCAMTAPEVFTPREEDGHGEVLLEDVPRELEGSVREAARSCPEQAIVIS